MPAGYDPTPVPERDATDGGFLRKSRLAVGARYQLERGSRSTSPTSSSTGTNACIDATDQDLFGGTDTRLWGAYKPFASWA